MKEMAGFIAMLAGPYLMVTGVGFLVSTAFYEKMIAGSAKSDPVLINLSGAVHFVVGLLILVQHFRFVTLPEAAVTLIGVLAALKGTVLIVAPGLALRSSKMSQTGLRFSALAFLLVGGYLTYIGYIEENF